MPQSVNVFIASPSDVSNERKYAENVITQLNYRTSELLGIYLHLISWENFIPIATKFEDEHIQDRFTRIVRKCGIFVGILYERYGTEINEERRISGTEEEFNTAMSNRSYIEILTYFRKPNSTISSEREKVKQFSKLQNLKEKLNKLGLLSHSYTTPSKFKERFTFDLFETVMNISLDVKRKQQLQSFFKFGIGLKHFSPSVLLAYPPIHKHVQDRISNSHTVKTRKSGKDKYNWQERLLPNVVYEDMKCIQKIEAVVRHLGVIDISSITLDHPKLDSKDGNRIWLCLPRNRLAQIKLDRFSDRAKFIFQISQGEIRPHINWKNSQSDEVFVHSPMEKYLKFQGRPKSSAWKPEFGSIVARDYAVIARFSDNTSRCITRELPFHHYFIAGIRGLGTWGAGWFIYNRPDELEKIVEIANTNNEDPQALLEITYSKHRILEAKNVSDENREYFYNQMLDSVVEEAIHKFH